MHHVEAEPGPKAVKDLKFKAVKPFWLKLGCRPTADAADLWREKA